MLISKLPSQFTVGSSISNTSSHLSPSHSFLPRIVTSLTGTHHRPHSSHAGNFSVFFTVSFALYAFFLLSTASRYFVATFICLTIIVNTLIFSIWGILAVILRKGVTVGGYSPLRHRRDWATTLYSCSCSSIRCVQCEVLETLELPSLFAAMYSPSSICTSDDARPCPILSDGNDA